VPGFTVAGCLAIALASSPPADEWLPGLAFSERRACLFTLKILLPLLCRANRFPCRSTK
jgi:hypothetical protein